ncbi:hypothetical protein AGOR_G00034810 [Albula goreensis]|uniref:GON-4-like protein n=1 Tax=Albula goreensis TaxID=1534307 RepID=A0A8T3E0D8_9TELE|nr:hypothetical protein AGOR_G00034810 [Albula goreensis]
MGQTIQACAENSTQPVSSRKFLPIKPAPPKPPPPPPKPLQVLTISAGGAVSMLELERGAKTMDKPGAVHHGLPATVIINMASPLATTVICPARVSEGLARPQGAVSRPSTTFAQPRNLGRPLLPAPPKQNPSENGPPICPKSATRTNSKPESLSNAKTPLILRSPEQVISSVDKLSKEGRTEQSSSPQKLSAPVGLSAQAPVALSNGSGEAVELRVLQNHLPAISHALAPAPAGGPKSLLLRSTSEGGSHLIFVPQNCVIAETTLPNITAVAQIERPSPGHVGGSQQGTARHPRKGSAMSPKPDLQNEAKPVEETAPRLSSVNPTSRKEKIGQGEGFQGLEEGGEDEEEEGQYGGDEEEEEEVGDLGGSPLALSESSESPVSSPGTLQRMEEEEGEGWSGLLASTPQHSPQGGEPGQRGQEWRRTKEEGLTDNIKDGEEDKEEEEVMSLASEESELSVPELQETMEKLSMLASEGMSFGEGDKNGPNSPNSPGSILSHASPNSSVSQNPKETEGLCEGEEPMLREGGSYKSAGRGVSSRGRRRGAGRGRDQSEVKRDGSGCRLRQRLTHRGRKKQGRQGMSKPTPPLNEEDAQDSDRAMESQDMAFAQAYLRRVCAAVWEAPGKVDEFLRVLYEFQQGGDRSSLVGLFGQLKSLLKDWPELLQDFAAFLQPEQARECGLLVEQQAFERSRRFLRQLEMSFEESPAHFQRIVHALQEGPSLTPAGLREMKSQIASLLKNHTHLQTEFWEFFDDITAFSQSVCPEGVAPSGATASQRPRRGARRRLNEVTHPVSEEGKESQNLGTPKKEEGPVCDWSVGGKDRPYRGSKRAAKPRRVSRKNGSLSRRKRGELLSPGSSTLPPGLHPEKRVGRRGEERRKGGNGVNIPHPASQPNSVNSSPDPPVCAQNVSLMPTGEKVILWTREADRMILTACQQKGAKHSTFKTVSTQLGNKTANEVSLRFQELMRLFHTTSRPAHDADHQATSDDDPD